MNTKMAKDLEAGDVVAEQDGCTWYVTKVERCGAKSVRVHLANVHHYMSANPYSVLVVRAYSHVRVVPEPAV